MTTIYADNAATTRMSQTAIQAMLPYMDKIYGNPSSLHLRRLRGRQPGHPLRCHPGQAEEQDPYHLHRL